MCNKRILRNKDIIKNTNSSDDDCVDEYSYACFAKSAKSKTSRKLMLSQY